MGILAAIIERDGPQYLPLFQRLEKEAEALQGDLSALERALELAIKQRGKAA